MSALKSMAAEATPHGRLLTSGEVGALYRVEAKTVSRWAAAGLLPWVKTPGGQYRFPEAAVLVGLAGR